MSDDLYARAKSVFFRAVELPTSARDGFVEHECGGDTALLAEVESLLAHHRAETLIASPHDTSPLQANASNAGAILDRPSRIRRMVWGVSRFQAGQIAVAAFLGILVLAAVGGWVHHGISTTLRQILGEKLRGMLDADVAAVELWIDSKKARVREWSRDRTLSEATTELLRIDAAGADARQRLSAAPPQAVIRARLNELAQAPIDYLLWDRTQTVVADSSPAAQSLARVATPRGAKLLNDVFHGETILCIERPTEPLVREVSAKDDVPMLTLIGPITGEDDRVVAAIMVRDIDRAGELNQILRHVFTGQTGECYAFDREGIMLTDSRFDEELTRLGLIPSAGQTRSATVVALRDPGGDLTAGYRPARPLATCPLTSMAAHAVAGENGIDLEGYRDYRGVEVIGAWKWLPKYHFGMAIEIGRWEAYSPLHYLDVAFGVLLVLLAAALAAVVISRLSIMRLRREHAARQLGQYTLEQLIGEGGMGQVYRARHALLKRPTAVKVLRPEHSAPEMLARFEQEVQLSSQLTHPNTIEIYDYGRTPEGVFYYAMEYIDGLNLSQVSALAGPLPAGRVIHILRQVCGSLREAHSRGLIHRDIKPQNIMLCCRGGEADVVKVLDFGLVKQMAPIETSGAASTTVIAGTPLYMAPERLLDPHAVDARSDLYSVGAVGYKLLTGEDVFCADGASSLLAQILELPAPRPSECTTNAVPRELDDVIAACLAKRADDRPESAARLLAALDAAGSLVPWSQRQALQWWQSAGNVCNSSRQPAPAAKFHPTESFPTNHR